MSSDPTTGDGHVRVLADDPTAEIEDSLRRLRVDQVDLYIVHWPQGGPTWAWPGMQRAHELGYARSIGVSNFDVGQLAQVLAATAIAPVVDQVQLSPFEYRRGLLEAAQERGVVVEAYSQQGTGQHLADETVNQVAERNGRKPAQVLLRWCVQKGLPVISKSTHRERLRENIEIFDFELSDSDVAELESLDRTRGTDRAIESTWW